MNVKGLTLLAVALVQTGVDIYASCQRDHLSTCFKAMNPDLEDEDITEFWKLYDRLWNEALAEA